MTTDYSVLPAEKALMDSLSIEQMVLVAKWLSSERARKAKGDYHLQVSENLGNLAHRVRGLAQLKQNQAALSPTPYSKV